MTEVADWVEDLEPVSRWVSLRCWLFHWCRHRFGEDSGVGVRYCPRCRLTLRVSWDIQESADD